MKGSSHPIHYTALSILATESAHPKVAAVLPVVEQVPLNARSQPAPEIIDKEEYRYLITNYGRPALRTYRLKGDEYLIASRKYRSQNRRGEVVLAIERPNQCLLVHRKSWYETGIYRLLTGGIDQKEGIENALWRELEEETGLKDGEAEFIGLLDCRMMDSREEVIFPSFVFHLSEFNRQPTMQDTSEDISDFRDLPIDELPRVADELKGVSGRRNGWGHWRAIAHEFVFEALST